MSHDTVKNGVIDILSECGNLDPNQITKETLINDLVDSLCLVDTIIRLEVYFQLDDEIGSRTAYGWETVGDVVDYIQNRLETACVNK